MKYQLHDKIIVATDLDGTLLDHFSYSWQAAKPSLEQLAERNIPIVINTSKTYAEVAQLQSELGIDAAFIVENGSAIYASKNSALAGYFEPYDDSFNRSLFGAERTVIIDALQSIREANRFKFESYADWQVEDVVRHTGLSRENAEMSLSRQFSDPLIWSDTEENYHRFAEQITERELKLIKGGRFIHVLGQCDKGLALTKLQNILYPDQESSLICLGDSHNDLAMLEIADIPVFVRSPVHDFPKHDCAHPPIYTQAFGPEGWHEAMQTIFNN